MISLGIFSNGPSEFQLVWIMLLMFKNLVRIRSEMCIVSEYISNNIKDIILNHYFSEVFSTTKKNIREKQEPPLGTGRKDNSLSEPRGGLSRKGLPMLAKAFLLGHALAFPLLCQGSWKSLFYFIFSSDVDS